MYLLYSLTLALLFVILLPYFAYKSINTSKYLANLFERLGYLPNELKSDGRPTLWLHAVSVGEALAAIPLVNALRSRYPDHRIVVSTTTVTGQAVARSRITSADAFGYFPFDWRFSASRTIELINPQIVVLMESELWPNFLWLCEQKAIPVLVANGRISDRSFQRGRRLRFLTKPILAKVSHFAMQSETDAERARLLGAPAYRVSVCGNVKYDLEAIRAETKSDEQMLLLESILDPGEGPLLIAGSTVDGEEELVLRSFEALRQSPGLTKTRLLIAPRHPDRFEKVAQLLEASGLRFIRRSTAAEMSRAIVAPSPEVILLDSIGELSRLFRFASVVFIGGSLFPRGGHNILEPALHARAIVVGPYMDNFRDITATFLRNDALVQLHSGPTAGLAEELAFKLKGILVDPEYATRLGLNAQNTIEAGRGATRRLVSLVETLIVRAGTSN